jgi:hypothetical protein
MWLVLLASRGNHNPQRRKTTCHQKMTNFFTIIILHVDFESDVAVAGIRECVRDDTTLTLQNRISSHIIICPDMEEAKYHLIDD